MIVDTHMHVVAEDPAKHPLRPSRPAEMAKAWYSKMPVTPTQMLKHMAEAGVDRGVLVQPTSAYMFDNNCIADTAAQYPGRFVSVCVLDMREKDAAARAAYWIEQRKVDGLGMYTALEPEATWLDDPVTYPVWEYAAKKDLSVAILLKFLELPRLRRVAERFPSVPVAINHLAYPPIEDGPPYAAAKVFFDLAKLPNIRLKFATGNIVSAGAGKSTPRDFFKALVDKFGAQRLLWGSNFPATYDRSYKAMLDLAKETLSFLPAKDQADILGENAARLWPGLKT